MRTTVMLVLGCLTIVPPCLAQRPREMPARPRLPDGADTNSAVEYFRLGEQRLRYDPEQAEAAFFWAGRLNPEAAEYPYARRVALMLADPQRLLRYVDGDAPILRSMEIRAIDSLLARAYMMDPFFHPRLDDALILEWIRRAFGRNLGSASGAIDHTTFEQIVLDIAAARPADAAWIAYSRRQFPDALRHWNDVARRNRRNAYIRAQRSRAFYQMGRFDSARVEMQSALEIARRRDADSVRYFYESKAQWQYSLGRIYEQLGDTETARAAYEQSLVEELAYYPAHIRLGLLHIARADTAAALREFARAVSVKEDEYLPRLTAAYFLANSGHLDSADAHLRRAIEIEPHAAQPRLMLGAVADQRGDRAVALEAFEAFLARAPRDDPGLSAVRSRVGALRANR